MAWNTGSRWLRWDPHLHTPGTLFNDQYGDDWTGFFDAIEQATPQVSVLGITDYCSLSGYEAFNARRGGRLEPVQLVFPNIELRLTVNTKRGGAINAHLLVSPEDPAHVARIKEALQRLEFNYDNERYPCTDDGLRRLGRAHAGTARLGDAAALRIGASQFKASESGIRDLLQDAWARRNVLLAVAAGQDGLGGLSGDSMWEAARTELGAFADLIFSGQPGDIDYWLGRKKKQPRHRKACLHGSDAHEVGKVLKPSEGRYCWIRGDASFESLRQVLAEPEHRVYIGSEPPAAAARGEIIKSVQVQKAPWLLPSQLELNDGLVTIIGAKGSGKTALLDMLALATDTIESSPGNASFFKKARGLLAGLAATARWADGSQTSGSIAREQPAWLASDRVQYLSQQFVERLTAPDDLSEPLVTEIERVVYSAIPYEDRLEAGSFDELRALRLRQITSDRNRHLEQVDSQSEQWLTEDAAARELPALQERARDAVRARAVAEAELERAKPNGDPIKLTELAALSSALGDVKASVAAAERRLTDLRDVKTRIDRVVASAGRTWESIRKEHPDLLSDGDWAQLKPGISAKGAGMLERTILAAEAETRSIRDSGHVRLGGIRTGGLTDLGKQVDALTTALGLDAAAIKRRAALEETVARAKATAVAAVKATGMAGGAAKRRSAIAARRLDAYEAIFGTFTEEALTLRTLYLPLERHLGSEAGKTDLRLNVARAVDIRAWAEAGETLFDLRTGPFQGRGSLERLARTELEEVWRSGGAPEVRAALHGFITRHITSDAVDLAHGASRSDVEEWLFDTGHIWVRYDLEYEGLPITRLSPGARGVVLLTLYLALDSWDARPLLIDQPEENLDPESVFKTLVPFFKSAARRRQIIMVTHNANLVVNTDSDQVVVAAAVRQGPDQLPAMSYRSGGLEDPATRADICALLEGGQEAFKKRSERYGLS